MKKSKSIATIVTTLGFMLSCGAAAMATPITSTNPTPIIQSDIGVMGVSPNQPQPGFTGYCMVTATPSLTVRSNPGTNYPPVGSLDYGDIVRVLSVSDGWAKIANGSTNGYVSTTYLNTKF